MKCQMPSFTYIWIKSLSTDFCLHSCHLCQLTFFICFSSIQPTFYFLLSNFCVAFSLKKPTSLTCVTQLVLLYFSPFLSFSIPFFLALCCYQMLDPTSAGCLWRSATAHLSGKVQLFGRTRGSTIAGIAMSLALERSFLPPILPSPPVPSNPNGHVATHHLQPTSESIYVP